MGAPGAMKTGAANVPPPSPFGAVGGYAPRVAITLDADAVRKSTAALMAYRLRVGGFVQGQGGAEVADFTEDTTPTLSHATEVTARNAALVSDDFPGAEAGDEPELRTIAALRSAIELEASAPQMDADRIRVWRDQLRESVERAGGGAAGGGGGEPGPGEPGFRVLEPVWNFGPSTAPRPPGSELEWPATSTVSPRRLRW